MIIESENNGMEVRKIIVIVECSCCVMVSDGLNIVVILFIE